mmetsp:Transcript_42462/g.100275  ORF Transcript_42462/g.100275 Transcript_42462/m.100275 type:complete len:227 (+) Transcript_42462:1194-1874(+)
MERRTAPDARGGGAGALVLLPRAGARLGGGQGEERRVSRTQVRWVRTGLRAPARRRVAGGGHGGGLQGRGGARHRPHHGLRRPQRHEQLRWRADQAAFRAGRRHPRRSLRVAGGFGADEESHRPQHGEAEREAEQDGREAHERPPHARGPGVPRKQAQGASGAPALHAQPRARHDDPRRRRHHGRRLLPRRMVRVLGRSEARARRRLQHHSPPPRRPVRMPGLGQL